MPIITYEEVTPSPVANANVKKRFIDGVHRLFIVEANEGYVLHDTRLDDEVIDENTLEPTGEVILGYTTGDKSVAASYDFTIINRATVQGVSGNSYIVDKVGANEFYTLPESEVPVNRIFGVPGNDHEIA